VVISYLVSSTNIHYVYLQSNIKSNNTLEFPTANKTLVPMSHGKSLGHVRPYSPLLRDFRLHFYLWTNIFPQRLTCGFYVRHDQHATRFRDTWINNCFYTIKNGQAAFHILYCLFSIYAFISVNMLYLYLATRSVYILLLTILKSKSYLRKYEKLSNIIVYA